MSYPHSRLTGLIASLATILLSANLAVAQTVSIENEAGEFGHGFMFDHRGTCYVVLPDHVAGESFFLTVRTAAPVANGSASVIRPFWPGVDLALAVARGGVADRCVETLDRLTAIPSGASRAVRAQLEQLTPAGEIDRAPLVVEDRQYLTFTGVLTETGARLGQGTSGAFAFVGENPIGMAITSDGETRADFMRIEEIAMNVERYLSEHGTTFAATAEPALPNTMTAAEALPLLLERASTAPTNPAFAAENILGDGLYVFEAVGRPEIVLRIGSDEAVGLSRVLLTAPTDAGFGFPRDVKIEFSPFPDGRRWFDFGTFQVAADGVLDTGSLQPRNARMVRIFVRSGWGSSPLAIGSVALFDN